MLTLVRSTQRVVSAAMGAVTAATSSEMAIVVRFMRWLLLEGFTSLRVQHVLAAPVVRRRRHQVLIAPRDQLLGRAVVRLRLQRGFELLARLVELARPVRGQAGGVPLPRF